MDSKEDAEYRLKLAKGYAKEAGEYFKLSHWRTCVSSAQLGTENACKAVLALYMPIVRLHGLSNLLMQLVEEHGLTGMMAKKTEALADNARVLGFEEHIRTDYGDELAYKTPWEIYDSKHAEKALSIVNESYTLAREIIEELQLFQVSKDKELTTDEHR